MRRVGVAGLGNVGRSVAKALAAEARTAVDDHPDVGALVLECTNFVPYSQAVRRAVSLPLFDLYTLVIETSLATSGHEFSALS